MSLPVLDIGEISARTGLKPSALRFYEAKGLVRPAGRHGLRRVYNAGTVERIALILSARKAGFTLSEIKDLFGSNRDDADLKRRLAAKADELEREAAGLLRMSDGLRHAVRCRHKHLADCPHFKRGILQALPAPPSVRLRK